MVKLLFLQRNLEMMTLLLIKGFFTKLLKIPSDWQLVIIWTLDCDGNVLWRLISLLRLHSGLHCRKTDINGMSIDPWKTLITSRFPLLLTVVVNLYTYNRKIYTLLLSWKTSFRRGRYYRNEMYLSLLNWQSMSQIRNETRWKGIIFVILLGNELGNKRWRKCH